MKAEEIRFLDKLEPVAIDPIETDKDKTIKEIPMMWTTYGNRPVASCAPYAEWTQDDRAIYMKIRWYDRSTKEMVHEDVNIYLKRGQAVGTKQAKLG